MHTIYTTFPRALFPNMKDLAKPDLECETAEEGLEVIRYDTSIYDTPFSKLPDQKRVWLGSPSSTLEGLGLHLCPHLSTSK